jgi:hypothetical protein
LLSDFAPALLAYRQVFAFYLDVEFDVFAIARVSPRVFTVFHSFYLSEHLFAFLLLKQLGKLQFAAAEGWVKVKLYNLSFKLYVVL